VYDEALIPMDDHQKKDKKTIYNSYKINQGESGAMLFPEKTKALYYISDIKYVGIHNHNAELHENI
jgi:hypothetical protein